jgi:hypothetical protein
MTLQTPFRVAPPNLPSVPMEYSGTYQNQLNNILRLFFSQISSAIDLPNPFGSFYASTSQANAGANVVQAVKFDTTLQSYNIGFTGKASNPSSRIYVSDTAVYAINCTVQPDQTAGNPQITIWIAVNGITVDGTGFISTADQHTTSRVFIRQLKNGDYVELYWSPSNNNAYLHAYAAAGSVPLIPSAALSLFHVSHNPSTGLIGT